MTTVSIGSRKIDLLLTVKAHAEIAELCPGASFSNFGEFINTSTEGQRSLFYAAVACALSSGAEDAKAFADPHYIKKPLDYSEAISLPYLAGIRLANAALDEINKGLNPTIEAEEKKDVKKNRARKKSS